MRRKQILSAFVLPPLVAPLVFVIFWVLAGTFELDDLWIALLWISPIAYAAAAVAFAPLVMENPWLKRTSIWMFLAAGALAGLSVSTLLDFIYGWSAHFLLYVLCCIAGSLSGFAYWAIIFGKTWKRLSFHRVIERT